jgi:hypothetical protein
VTDRYIADLRDVIRKVHGVDSRHLESVPVKEIFKGRTVWEGVVEVFELIGHAKAPKVYAWAHETENPDKPVRHVTVLHQHPIRSAHDAVKIAIAQEIRSLGTAEES